MTARARMWLQRYFGAVPGRHDRLPDTLRRWVEQHLAGRAREDGVSDARTPLTMEGAGRRPRIRLVAGPGRHLLLMEEQLTAVQPNTLEAFGLSRRETEVLTCVAQGLTNETVGSLLGISSRTVQKHLERIFQKLGVETRTAAAARAMKLVQQASGSEDRPA